MKNLLFIFVSLLFIFTSACRNSAQEKPNQYADAMWKSFGVPTSEDGYFMKAVINGEQWTAERMMEINKSNDDHIVGAGGGTRIGFYIDRRYLSVGKKRELVVTLIIDNNIELTDKSAELEITKTNDKIIEGIFNFTAQAFQSDKNAEATDGFFRILLSDN